MMRQAYNAMQTLWSDMKDEEGCLAAECRGIAAFRTTWQIPNVVHFQMRIDGLGVDNLNLRR